MIYAEPDATFTAMVSGAPTGLAGTLGIRIEASDGTTVVARTTAGIVEVEAGSGVYAKDDNTAPSDEATYVVLWDTGSGTFAAEELIVTSSPPVTVAPSGVNLCTVADVRLLLQKQSMEVDQDTLIAIEIGRASAAIQKRCGQFRPMEDDEAKRFVMAGSGRPAGGYRLDLFPFYARSITAVSIDPDGTPDVLGATDWRARPLNALDGMLRWIRLPNRYFWPLWEAEVEVTGDWGFASVPGEVVQATAITVVEWIRKDVQAFSTTYLLNEERLDRPEMIPRGARMMLADYWREGQG